MAITSRQNPLVARFRDAARGDADEVILLDGAHLVGEALDAGIHIHLAAVTPAASEKADIRPLLAALARAGADIATVAAPVMDAISPVRASSGIVALGERPEQFRLAISIHAPNDGLRQELMPINTKYPLAQVIEAAKVFDRRVTFEYVMLGGVNDREEHALQLARLAKECRAFVNLIPLHPGGARGFTPSTPDRIRTFARELRNEDVEVAVRKSRGIDIAAACGQLRVERLGRRPPRRAQNDDDVQVA